MVRTGHDYPAFRLQEMLDRAPEGHFTDDDRQELLDVVDVLQRGLDHQLTLARKCYLLTLCRRPGIDVHRSYLDEKVTTIFNIREPAHIRGLLDTENQAIYDRLMAEEEGR